MLSLIDTIPTHVYIVGMYQHSVPLKLQEIPTVPQTFYDAMLLHATYDSVLVLLTMHHFVVPDHKLCARTVL